MTQVDNTGYDAKGEADAALRRFELKRSEFKEHYAEMLARRMYKKVYNKIQNEAEKQDDYNIGSFLTDLIGIRVICLYETDIPIIEDLIRRNFKVLSVTNKTQALLTDIRSFGYKGLHLDIALTDERHSLPEYSRFKELRAEVQIRSIVQDAWSEVEHRLRYKKQAPPEIQRRVVRLAALFELADQEFSALHSETERLLTEAKQDDALEQSPKEKLLDAISFFRLVHKFHPKYKLEDEAVDGFVDEVIEMDKNFKFSTFQAAVAKFRDLVWEYKQFQRQNSININPFTEMRHVLFAHNKAVFADMLYPKQREAFEDWIRREKGITI